MCGQPHAAPKEDIQGEPLVIGSVYDFIGYMCICIYIYIEREREGFNVYCICIFSGGTTCLNTTCLTQVFFNSCE